MNLSGGQGARRIGIRHRIVATVGKHVIAQEALAGGGEDIGIYEAADGGVVIAALQIV